MNTFGTLLRSSPSGRAVRLALFSMLTMTCSASTATAQSGEEEESSITLNALVKTQGGLFVPLASDGFKPHKNEAVSRTNPLFDDGPCDPIETPSKPCYPSDHGKKPFTPSIARATLQIEAQWDFSSKLSLHTIIRGVRSAPLEADEYAQVPLNLAPEMGEDVGRARRAYAKDWVRDNYYNRFELREFYLDALPTYWLTFRIGRQQLAWGETGSFRLLDVVNPIDSTWHFGPLEAFEDQRIPLWMALTTIDVNLLQGALELLYIPGLDRGRDTVSPPLSNAGAWGIPYSNQPGTYRIGYKDFQYPGGEVSPKNMRGGARWKGDIGDHTSYSLVYFYTHMQTPVLQYADQHQETEADGTPIPGLYSANFVDRAVLNYPRQHIAGLSLEHTLDSPFGLTARFEGAVEPNRSYSQRTDTAGNANPKTGRISYTPIKKMVVTYALVLQRPTMIRWLNPTQNFLLVAQFMHSAVPGVDDIKDNDYVQVIGYNDWRIQRHSYTLVFYATTNYFNGLFTPRLTGVYLPNPYYKDSGFVSLDLGFRIGPHYRVNVMATDFVGKDPYRDIGLFRDRDEVHASATVLF